MTTIDKEKLEIQVSETLSFEHHVVPVLEDVLEGIRVGLEEGEYTEGREEEAARSILSYVPTKEDKVKILELILETYEDDVELYHNISIFDELLIEKGIKWWIEGKFNISII